MAKYKCLTRIPRISLNISNLMQRADINNDLVSFASEIKGLGYVGCIDDGLLVITNRRGYLRLAWDELETFRDELNEYIDQLKVRQRLA